MEKKEPYIVAWTDEDGMRYEKFPSLEKAQGKLCSLFEEQAGEEYSDDGLGYYVEEWEPELKDPDSDEDEYGFRKRRLYHLKQEMRLYEEDAVLTEDTAYLRENRYGERFKRRKHDEGRKKEKTCLAADSVEGRIVHSSSDRRTAALRARRILLHNEASFRCCRDPADDSRVLFDCGLCSQDARRV